MNKRSKFLALAVLLALPVAAAAIDGTKLIDQARALAGGLTPGDTPGFPVIISVAGSYRLSGNLTVPNAETTAIEITAENVTLDLNGFAIIGPTVCSGVPMICAPTGLGVGVLSERSYAAVRNGMVRGMGSAGVRLNVPPGGASTRGQVVADLQVQHNGTDGIVIGGGSVRNSDVRRNGGRGITVESGTLSGNTVSLNSGIGIRISGTGTVSGNYVGDNDGCGISSNAGLISGNTVLQNDGGLCLTQFAGYLGNVIIGNTVGGGVNLGQNLCGDLAGSALCP